MEKNIISWNVQNWLTVVLMVAIAYSLIGILVSFLQSNLPNGKAEA